MTVTGADYNKWIEKANLYHQERDEKLAAEALEWAAGQPNEGVGDYLYNLGVACRAGYVVRKTAGIVASSIQAYLTAKEREEEITRRRSEDAKKARGLVGEVKKRQVFEKLTVRTVRYIDGNWGTTTLVVFEDEPGNLIKWFASTELDELEEGDIVNIKATVKKHDEYNGVPETVVNRAVILEKLEVAA